MKFHPDSSFAVLYSNTSGYVSYQRGPRGGCLIDAFCKVMKNQAMNGKKQKHFHEMIVDIRRQVKHNSGIMNGNNNGDITQLVDFHGTLEWHIYFGVSKFGYEIDAAEKKYEKLQLQISSATDNINHLRKERDNVRKQVSLEAKQLKALENASILAQEQAKTAEMKTRECKQKVKDLEFTISNKKKTVYSLKQNIKTEGEHLSEIRERCDEESEEYAHLQQQTAELEEQKVNLENKIASNIDKNAILEQKYDEKHKRYLNLWHTSNTTRREINNMQVEKAGLENDLNEMRQEVIEKEKEIARLHTTSNVLSILTKQVEESTANANLKCSVCDLSFGSRRELDCHKRQHNNEKAHLCSFCLRRFFKLGECRRHAIVCGERERMNNGGIYCDCGEALIKCTAQNAYDCTSFITCHDCGKRRRGNTTIYHCQRGCCDKCVSCVRKM